MAFVCTQAVNTVWKGIVDSIEVRVVGNDSSELSQPACQPNPRIVAALARYERLRFGARGAWPSWTMSHASPTSTWQLAWDTLW